MTVQQSSPPQQGHGIGGLLVLGLLVASHRLRRGLGWIAVALVVLGGLLLLLSAADPDLGGVGGVLMLIGALGLGWWAIATGLAWLLRIAMEDVAEKTKGMERRP
jgi:hypothetical protein